MTEFVQRVRVLVTNVVPWLVYLSTALSTVLVELEPYKDVAFVGVLAKWGGVAVSAIAAAVLIARRVTEVPVPERGLLPQEPQQSFWETR